jgi:hypothetical protein
VSLRARIAYRLLRIAGRIAGPEYLIVFIHESVLYPFGLSTPVPAQLELPFDGELPN